MVSASAPEPRPWHAGFLAMLPALIKQFRFAFRHLGPEARAENLQNCVANAAVAYARLYELGKIALAYPSVLGRYAISQTKDFRVVGGHLAIKDVLSPYCQAKKNVKVERLDKYDRVNECWFDPEDCCHELLAESRNVTPASLAASRIDFSDWMRSLPVRHRRIAQYLSLGNRTSQAARKFKVSAGRISQLRKELAANWRAFLGDDPGPAAANAA